MSATAPIQTTPTSQGTGVAGRDRASASQARLVWLSFRKHKLAVASAFVMLFVLFVMAFAEFLAPFGGHRQSDEHTYNYAPPQTLRFLDRADDGSWQLGLHVYDYDFEQDPESLRVTYVPNEDERIPVRLFARGEEYSLLGFIPWDRHLIGPVNPDDPMYLLGTDRFGRDQLSRIIYATRISMSVGLLGVALAFVLGILLGGLAGYFGGAVDNVIMRLAEFVIAVPSIPLWLGLAAALPVDMSPLLRYFLITTILASIAWSGIAREVRGRFLAMRSDDFVVSASLDGASRSRVMFRHMLPLFTSHLIAVLTLRIPEMILAETALSWLGLGLRSPVVSWGVLLEDATSIRVVAQAPWLLIPGLAVVITVLALNFIGDGLRDAADPYRR